MLMVFEYYRQTDRQTDRQIKLVEYWVSIGEGILNQNNQPSFLTYFRILFYDRLGNFK